MIGRFGAAVMLFAVNHAPAADVEHDDRLAALWKLPILWSDPASDFLNELRIVGRVHLDAFAVSSNSGNDSDLNVRRMRVGLQAKLFHRLELHSEVDFQPSVPGPLYFRLSSAYAAWTFSDAARLCVGKQFIRFTLDGATSSNDLLTLERNAIAGDLWAQVVWGTGVELSGTVGNWSYRAGAYSGVATTQEFPSSGEGWYGVWSLGYDFAKTLGVKKALLQADYVYTEPSDERRTTLPFEQVASLNFQLDAERAGVSTDLAVAKGRESQGDVFGFVVMPWFRLTSRAQAVVRFTWLTSNAPNGLRLQRYDNTVSLKRGDEYTEYYGGLNYYIRGNQLKLQTGVSYAVLANSRQSSADFRGWNWISGIRVSW